MKKAFKILLFTLLFILMLPVVAHADSYDSTHYVVIIDTNWTGTLEEAVDATGAPLIYELHITSDVSSTLTSTDLFYIRGLSNLKVLDVASTVDIVDVGDDFLTGMGSLTTVNFPATTYGESAFRFCRRLTNVNLPNAVTFGHQPFRNCNSLVNITLPKATTFGTYAFYECGQLVSASLPKAISFIDHAFATCPNLTTVSMPELTTFGDSAFNGCIKLKNVTLPKAKTFGRAAFLDCDSYIDINLPSATTFGDYAFGNADGLTSIYLPEATTFDKAAFYNCTKLETAYLPKATTFDRQAFMDCAALTTVNLPQAVTFADYEFHGCEALTDVILPKVETIGSYSFVDCNAMTTLSLPELQEIGDNSMKSCSMLETVYFPKLLKLGARTFDTCIALKKVSMPMLSRFDGNAFSYCTQTICMTLGTRPYISVNLFYYYAPQPKNAVVMVPQAEINTYDIQDGIDGYWHGWKLEPVRYSITYDGNNNTTGTAPIDANSPYLQDTTVTILSNSGNLTRDGYTYDGWNTDVTGEGVTYSVGGTFTSTSDVTLYAKWVPRNDIPYKVEHYKQNDGDYANYTLVDTDDKTGTTDTLATAQEKTYEGYSPNLTHPSSKPSGNIDADGSLVLKLYYDINQYDVTFDENGGNPYDKSQTVRHDGKATAPTINPTRAGYTFDTWYKEEGCNTAWNFAIDTITADTTIYANWIPNTDTAYTIEYYKQNADDDNYTLASSESKVGTTDTLVTIEALSFPQFYENTTHTDRNVSDNIYGDGSLVLKRYYDRETYTVTYDENGGQTYDTTQTVRYNGKTSAPLPAPSYPGYTFDGWYKDEECNTVWDFAVDTVTGDTTLYADWVVNLDTAYRVEHYKQNIDDDDYTLMETENNSGTTDTLATASAKTYIGFTENVSHADRITSGNIAGDGTLVLKLFYDRNTHTVTYNENGGQTYDQTQTVRYDGKATAPTNNPTYTGNTFTGWYKEAVCSTLWDFDNDKVTLDTTLYAGWEHTAVLSIQFDIDEITFRDGVVDDINFTMTPADAFNQSIIWESSNPLVATIDSSGMITTHSVGSTIIKMTSGDTTNGILTDSITLNVIDPNGVPVEDLSGTLIDSDGNPLAGYTIVLHSDPITRVTDANGKFLFEDVPFNNHTMIVSNGVDEIGRYKLSFTGASAQDSSIDNTAHIAGFSYTSSTMSVDLLLQLTESGDLQINAVDFTAMVFTQTVAKVPNPETGEPISQFSTPKTLFKWILVGTLLCLVAMLFIAWLRVEFNNSSLLN